MAQDDSRELEDAIGYSFRTPELLLRAITHRSYLRESRVAGEASNEQMEFLGDAILGLAISEALLGRFPSYSEGQLSKWKAHLVSASHLHEVALRIGLGPFLRLGRGEERSGGRSKKTLLADAVEALIAAIYLDSGLEAARQFVRRWCLESVDWEQTQVVDFKSELQEFLQGQRAPQPRYVVVREKGPEHHKVFMVRVQVGALRLGQAQGDSKKAAQQAAARIALEQLRRNAVGTGSSQTGT
ncbi:MAG: ribonuclease III [Acidobacteria bacterium]|nr:ribonuclease III [Acidobacteriota bacterium]